MRATSKMLVATALLVGSLPAAKAEESSNVAPVSLPSASVKCPGISNIPLTADPEQALPLQVIRPLVCGEIVVVLADSEGYTTHVRTQDGKDGYVARMYLTETSATPKRVSARHTASATAVNGIARWMANTPGCDEFISQGRHVESITANGITVQVSVQDTGWKYRANIAISNSSSKDVDVTPGIITLDELMPRMRTLPAADSKTIAHTSTHQVLWTLADALPSPSAGEVRAKRNSKSTEQLVYRDPDTPDYLNPRLTLASSHPEAFARTDNIDVNAIAMKYQSVAPGEKTTGVMWFARDPGAHELSLRVPVGDMVFDFSFAFEPKK